MKSADMLAIIDFIYCGESNVFQENLDSFLAIAEELQLKGLMGKREENFENENKNSEPKVIGLVSHNNIEASRTTPDNKQMQNSNVFEDQTSKTVAVQNYTSEDLDDLDEKVRSMMQKTENRISNGTARADMCKVCGKEGQFNNIKAHIETNHLDGMTFPCNLCEKAPRSRHALKMHKNTNHT